jgi:hypothetical protein
MMKTCEAIIRLAVVKARNGDARALTTVLGILEKLGATKDVTSEERRKRTINLTRAHTMEEYNLLFAPARSRSPVPAQQSLCTNNRDHPPHKGKTAARRSFVKRRFGPIKRPA